MSDWGSSGPPTIGDDPQKPLPQHRHLVSSGLVTPFAERQRLVGKPDWDALEKRYAAE